MRRYGDRCNKTSWIKKYKAKIKTRADELEGIVLENKVIGYTNQNEEYDSDLYYKIQNLDSDLVRTYCVNDIIMTFIEFIDWYIFENVFE